MNVPSPFTSLFAPMQFPPAAMHAHTNLMLTMNPAFNVSTDHQEPLPERANGHPDGQLPSDSRPSGS